MQLNFPPESLGDEARWKSVAKPEWGTKRICPSCGVRFYDLRRTPVTCPKCETVYEAEAPAKPRRTAAAEAKKATPAAAVEVAPPEVAAVVAADPGNDADVAVDTKVGDAEDVDDETLKAGKEDKGTGLIEDASELGEDEDDMAEVIDVIKDDKS